MGGQADRQQTAMTSMATCIQAHTMGLMMEAGGPKGQDGNGRWPVAAGKPSPHEHSKRTTNPRETGLRNVTDQRPPDGVQVKSGVGTSRVPRQDWTGLDNQLAGNGREEEEGKGKGVVVCVCPRWWFASRDAATCKQQQSRCRQPAKSTMGRVVVVDSRPTDYARMHLPEDKDGPWTGAG